MNYFVISAILLVVLALWIIITYNKLIVSKNKVVNAFAQVDTQLQRRFDLIPNLVETVKGYASHEKNLLENVTSARSKYVNANSDSDKINADNELTSMLKTLFAVAENYPELKANQNFLNLQEQLSEIESKIAFSRQFYNDSVTLFNNTVQTFPNNIVAGMFNFKEYNFFTAEKDAREAPKVQF